MIIPAQQAVAQGLVEIQATVDAAIQECEAGHPEECLEALRRIDRSVADAIRLFYPHGIIAAGYIGRERALDELGEQANPRWEDRCADDI